MPKALVIYDTFTGHTRKIAERLKNHLEHCGFAVELFRDKKFAAFESVASYDVVALGAPCHGGMPAATLKRKLGPLFSLDLSEKKFIAFGAGTDAVTNGIISYMANTKIRVLASIACRGKSPSEIDEIIAATVKKGQLQ